MKSVKLVLIAFAASSLLFSCSTQTNKGGKSVTIADKGKAEVYYFHYTRRCATCKAVESVSKEAVAELYGDKVNFAGFNLDEESSDTKAKELGISGQTLLIVTGDTNINITNEGFMEARSNPEKLKAIIKEKIDPLL